jgi:hypothetical protein
LKHQISQLNRDQTSEDASYLLRLLEDSKIKNEDWLNDIQTRLITALEQLAERTEMIHLTSNILQESLNTPLIEKDPTDNLILHCILDHARQNFTDTKVLISGNTKDFGTSEVQEALHNAGIVKYFASTRSFLGWLESQS